jgi:hypothetical protein
MEHHALLGTSVLIGTLLLLFGRRLFWLFVAAIGFWIGFSMTPYLTPHPPAWLGLVLALFLGLIGAIFAFVLQKIAISVAGFLVGGYVAIALLNAFVSYQAHFSAIVFIVGGVIGAILMLVLFDWALILFSSIAGAELIVTHIHLPPTGSMLLLVGLTVAGVLLQSTMLRRRRL